MLVRVSCKRRRYHGGYLSDKNVPILTKRIKVLHSSFCVLSPQALAWLASTVAPEITQRLAAAFVVELGSTT